MRVSTRSILAFVLGVFALLAAPACTIINGSCDPSRPGAPCGDDDDCADRGAWCDRALHRCSVPVHGPDAGASFDARATDAHAVADAAAGGCANDGQCDTGDVCIDGACRPAAERCQFNYQCRSGQDCVNGRCRVPCAGESDGGTNGCARGQQCGVDGYCQYREPTDEMCPAGCTPGEACARGVCLPACAADGDCAASERCVEGACRADEGRAPPFCATDAQCAPGSVCRDGVCRVECPSGADEDCLRRDVIFNRCSPAHLCVSAGELRPGCALSVDCATGAVCVDGRCR